MSQSSHGFGDLEALEEESKFHGNEPSALLELKETLEKVDGEFEITASHLSVAAKIPGADNATFQEIANRTKRSYQLDTEQVMLLSAAGGRVKPLAEKKGGFPMQALGNQTIAPGTSIKGYLYYPQGSYSGARGSLTEAQSHEREGFDVRF